MFTSISEGIGSFLANLLSLYFLNPIKLMVLKGLLTWGLATGALGPILLGGP